NTYVGTEHLLLGLLIHSDGIAAHVLEDLGANLDKVRHELDSLLKEQGVDAAQVHYRISGRGEGESEQQGAGRPGPSGWIGYAPGSSTGHGLGPVLQWQGRAFAPVGAERAWPNLEEDLRDLTSEAKSAVALAEEEAVKAAAVYIGPEHLVLGLLRQGEGLASRALTALGLDLGQARTELRRERPPEARVAVPAVVPSIGFWTVVEAARKDARRARLAWVDTDHLLLAMVASPYDAGIRLLSALGVTGPAIAEKLEAIRGGPSG
ncbi:MAG TPA: Clp protease N-terminal domain-containing protein, partial [Candidatus Dormibacteraeota bacterium]